MPRSDAPPIALLRLTPLLFPAIFLSAALSGGIVMLYAAVILHLLIIAAELTIGRRYADLTIPPLVNGSTAFEDACMRAWTVLHVVTICVTLYFVETASLTCRQAFAVGALFGYSINTFSAVVAHEMLHRKGWGFRISADLLYTLMLYPHFPTIHLCSHHRWAGSRSDCQTPRPNQTLHAFLVQAFIGGIRTAQSRPARSHDRRLGLRVMLGLSLLAALLAFGAAQASLFLVAQGLFSFLLIETVNFIQHDNPQRREGHLVEVDADHAAQDLNFVSRCLLFNLPLHAAHHERPDLACSELVAVAVAPTSRLGYWCSFWLAWCPPLWHSLRRNQSLYRG